MSIQSGFRIVCKGRGVMDYVVDVEAPDVDSARAAARAQGHDPLLVFPASLPRREQHLIVRAWRAGSDSCPACGYCLAGLPPTAWIVCPECGLGAPGDDAGQKGAADGHG